MSCLINSMNINVIRQGHKTNVRGKLMDAPRTTFQIKGNLQPETNLRTIRETFGSHIEGAIKIYSEQRLRTKESDGAPDIIDYQGREWEVEQVRRYDTEIPHYKIIALLKKDER